MSTKENVQIVKDFFAAIGAYNKQDLLALVAAEIPARGGPRAGAVRQGDGGRTLRRDPSGSRRSNRVVP